MLSGGSSRVFFSKSEERHHSGFGIQNYRAELDTDVHLIGLKELCTKLGTDSERGLTLANAERLLKLNGPNSLTPPAKQSNVVLYLKSMFSGFLPLFWIGSFMDLIAFSVSENETEFSKWYTAFVLIMAAVITGTFGFIVETNNSKMMDGFKRLLPQFATVTREGKIMKIPVEEVVVGDLLLVQAGDRLPADILITECQNFKVDNSSMTGQTELLKRSANYTHLNPLETENLIFSSSVACEGYAQGIAFACGDNTLFGKIAKLTTSVKKQETSVRKEIKQFNQKMSYFAFIIACLSFITALATGHHLMHSMLLFVGFALANTPLGLQLAFTGCLSLVAKRMMKRNCFIKNLDSIEILGAADTIFMDQIGTITESKKKVMHAWFNEKMFNAEGTNQITFNAKDPGFEKLLMVGILSRPRPQEMTVHQEIKETGVDESITQFAENIFETVYHQDYIKEFSNKFVEIFTTPVGKNIDCHFTIYYNMESKRHSIVMRGTPEIILKRCSFVQLGSEKVTDETRYSKFLRDLETVIVQLASAGEHVVAFCSADLDPNKYPKEYPFAIDPPNFPLDTLTFIGLLSTMNPIRPNAAEAIAKCRMAGLRVVLITPDHPVAAVSIARKVGIISEYNDTLFELAIRANQSLFEMQASFEGKCEAIVITGDELCCMSALDLETTIETHSEIVFARISPQQKLMIVETFQRKGNIVVFTGNGINDSPALKKADIGISMGQSGSDVSKDAACIILVDDNISSIVYGIEEGRLLFDNLKKIIAYTLTSTIIELIPFLVFAILKIPLPLTITAILCIDIGIEIWPALSLAYEYPESDLMTQKPRNVKTDRLISNQLLMMSFYHMGNVGCLAGFTSYFMIMYENGFYPTDLLFAQSKWISSLVNDLMDSFGQQWTYTDRMRLQKDAVTAYIIAVLETQWADLLICKTRRLSLFQHGLQNWCLNVGILFETMFIYVACYTPIGSHIFGFTPISWKYWLLPLFFAAYTIIFDEIRKIIIRRYPGGAIEKGTYF